MSATLVERPPDGVLDQVMTWIMERLQSARSARHDPAVRALLALTDPVLAARDEPELAERLDTACSRLGPFLQECVHLAMKSDGPAQEDAAKSLRWMLQRVAAGLDEDDAVSELAALLELHRRGSAWLIEAVPGATLVAGAALADFAATFEEVLKDEHGRAYVRASTGVLTFVRLLDGGVSPEPWLKHALLQRSVDDFQGSMRLGPFMCTRGGFSWLQQTLLELGLWFAAPFATPESRTLLERRLEVPRENRGALKTLFDRSARSKGPYFYFGDLRHTFEQVMGGAAFYEEVRRRGAAFDDWSHGRIPLSSLATECGVTAPDMLVSLDAMGLSRDLDTIRLSDDERASILSRARRDRLERKGVPPTSPAMVAREVIATQRIEGVDARAFFRGARSERPGG